MNDLDLRRLVFRNTGLHLLSHGVSLGVGLATTLILSRYLEVEGFGKFSYLFAFYYFLLTIMDFGVNSIVVREISQRRERANEIIGAMLTFKLLLAVAVMAAAWGLIALRGYAGELRAALFLFSLILPLTALQLPLVMFQVALQAKQPALIGIANRVLGFALMIIAAGMGGGLVTLVGCLLLGEALAVVLALGWSRRLVRLAWRFDPTLWRQILRASVPLGLAMFCAALINRIDFIMLEQMRSMEEVGLYAAAYKVTNLLEALPLLVMGTVYPLMARYAAEDPARLRDLYRKCLFYLGGIALPMGVLVTALAPWIIRGVFGEKFAGAERGLMALVWASVFLYFSVSGGNVLISLGKEKASLAINAAGAALNVGLNFLLIPRFGFVGAALATSATFFVVMIAISWRATRALRAMSPLHELRTENANA